MAVAASGPITVILQSDWFISGGIFPLLSVRVRDLKKPCLCRTMIKMFHNISNENVLRTIRKGKVTM